MQIDYPRTLLPLLKHRHVLLDTNVFIDAFINPVEFAKFFNLLKDNDTILTTIEVVRAEFVKGFATEGKYDERCEVIDNLIEYSMPITSRTFETLDLLVKEYKQEGAALSMTDLLIGATLRFYSGNLLLMTKDLSDFPQNIFKLEGHFQLIHRKAIQSYGILSYR